MSDKCFLALKHIAEVKAHRTCTHFVFLIFLHGTSKIINLCFQSWQSEDVGSATVPTFMPSQTSYKINLKKNTFYNEDIHFVWFSKLEMKRLRIYVSYSNFSNTIFFLPKSCLIICFFFCSNFRIIVANWCGCEDKCL
jgi:hypothetical protein